jgi:hypothetical protein
MRGRVDATPEAATFPCLAKRSHPICRSGGKTLKGLPSAGLVFATMTGLTLTSASIARERPGQLPYRKVYLTRIGMDIT